MKSRYFTLVLIVCSVLSFSAFSHEGDEEVSVKNAPRFGGKVAAVVLDEDHWQMNKPLPKHKEDHKDDHKGDHKDEKKGEGKHAHEDHNDAKYMSEILVSDENKVRLYFYNTEMKDIDLANFPAELVVNIKSQNPSEPRGQKITLKKSGKNYIGELPPIKKKPYDMYIDFHVKDLNLHISFNSMD